jgi:hypothetical protein
MDAKELDFDSTSYYRICVYRICNKGVSYIVSQFQLGTEPWGFCHFISVALNR